MRTKDPNPICTICKLNVKLPRRARCQSCHNDRKKELLAKKMQAMTPEEKAEKKADKKKYFTEWRKNHSAQLLLRQRACAAKIKEKGIAAYGGKCTCCGESNPKFLTIEHLKGRQNDCKNPYTGKRGWLRLSALKFPKDDYTILCFNCNCAKGIYGICPHQSACDNGIDCVLG